VAFILVAAVAAGALAGGAYALVRSARLSDSETRGREQLERAVQAARLLPSRPNVDEDVQPLLARFTTQASETVAVVRGQPVGLLARTPGDAPGDLTRLVEEGQPALERVAIGGVPYLVLGAPVSDRRMQLFVFVSEQGLFQDLRELGLTLLVGWGVVTVLAGLVGSLLARRTLAPVARASDAARSLAEGLLETRLPEEGNDEFGAWAASFNEMAQALEAKIAALQEARDRERRFTSDVSHELRTPLTAIVSEASVLRDHLDRMPEDMRLPAQMLVRDVARLRRMVEDLMEISRLDAGGGAVRIEPVDAGSLVQAVVRSRGWDGRVRMIGDSLVLDTDRRRLERVVSNLIGNALEHGGRHVTVRTARMAAVALLEVVDQGPGIRPEDLPHLFDRFYKADPSRSSPGSGLGLAIALENARLLGGDIEVWSEVGTGTRFTVRLPVTQRLPGGEGAVSSDVDDGATTGEKGGTRP
jgi:two-component system sensor histidine kinase MtrB